MLTEEQRKIKLGALAALTLPPADRIALARELLEGTGRFVAKQHTQVLREYPGGSRAVQTVLVADYPDATSENTP